MSKSLFIPTDLAGDPVINRDVTLALTTRHLNNMSPGLQRKVLNYPGDQSYWIEPKSWLGLWWKGGEPNHRWCPGKLEVFATSGFIVHREHYRCNVCGATITHRLEY